MGMLRNILTWLGAIAWHLWRMLSGRPAFRNLGDTSLTLMSFLGVFVAAGLLRWAALGATSVPEVGINLFLQGSFYTLIAYRRHRSTSLLCAYFGVSAGVDLVVATSYLVGILPSVHMVSASNMLLQLVLMFIATIQFHREPLHVQTAGYRASQAPRA